MLRTLVCIALLASGCEDSKDKAKDPAAKPPAVTDTPGAKTPQTAPPTGDLPGSPAGDAKSGAVALPTSPLAPAAPLATPALTNTGIRDHAIDGSQVVIAVRLPKSVGQLIDTWLPTVFPAGVQQAKQAIADLNDKSGMDWSGVDAVDFAIASLDDMSNAAAFIHGPKGQHKDAKQVGDHNGIALYSTPKQLGAGPANLAGTVACDWLVIAPKNHIGTALDLAMGRSKPLAASSKLGALLDAHAQPSVLSVTATGGALGKIAKQLPGPLAMIAGGKLEGVGAYIGADGIRLVFTSSDAVTLQQLNGMFGSLLAMARSGLSSAQNNPQLGMLFSSPDLKSIIDKALTAAPQTTGDKLIVHVPIEFANPKVLATLTGMAAGVAMGAFQKYTGAARKPR